MNLLISKKFTDSELWIFGILATLVGGIYHLSVRWVDRHGDWSQIRQQWPSKREVITAIIGGLAAGILFSILF